MLNANRFSLIGIFILIIAISSNAQSRIIQVGSKFGIVNKSISNFVVQPIYDKINAFDSLGQSIVIYKGKWGVIDSNGIKKVPFIYDEIRKFEIRNPEDYHNNKRFNEEFFIVNQNKKFGIVNNKGEVVLPLIFDEVNENYLTSTFQFCGEKCVLFNINGKIIYQGHKVVEYENTGFIVESNFWFDSTGLERRSYGFLDMQGKFIVPLQESYLRFVNSKLISISDSRNGLGLIDITGKLVLPKKFYNIYQAKAYRNGNLVNIDTILAKSNDTIYSYNFYGKKLPHYEVEYKNGIQYDSETGNYGLMKNNIFIIKPEFNELVIKGKYVLGIAKSGTTLFDTSGTKLGACSLEVYQTVYDNSDKYLPFFITRTMDMDQLLDVKLNKIGMPQQVISPQSILHFNNKTLFKFQKGEKMGLFDDKGKIVFPASEVIDIRTINNKLFSIELADGKFDIYDSNLKKIKSGVSQYEQIENTDICLVDIDQHHYIIGAGFDLNQSFESVNYNQLGKVNCFIVTVKNKNGIFNVGGKLMIPFKYDYIATQDSFLMAKNEVGYFTFTNEFKLIDSLIYKDVAVSDLGYIAKNHNGKFCLLHTKTREKVSRDFDAIFNSNESGYFYTLIDNKYGMIDTSGQEKLSNEWDTITYCNISGVFFCWKSKKAYLYNSYKSLVYENHYDSLICAHPLGTIVKKDLKYGYFSSNSHLQFFDKIVSLSENSYSFEQNGKWGVIRNDSIIFQAKYDSPFRIVENNKFQVKLENELLQFNSNCKIIFKAKADWINYHAEEQNSSNSNFKRIINVDGVYKNSDDYFQNKINGGKYFIVNDFGKVLNSNPADCYLPINIPISELDGNGYEKLFGYVWNQGGYKEQYIYDTMHISSIDEIGNEIILAATQTNERIVGGKNGLIDLNGKIIIPCEFDRIKFFMYSKDFNSGQLQSRGYFSVTDSLNFQFNWSVQSSPAIVQKGNKWGVYNLAGKNIIPVDFDSIQMVQLGQNDYYKCFRNNLFGFMI